MWSGKAATAGGEGAHGPGQRAMLGARQAQRWQHLVPLLAAHIVHIGPVQRTRDQLGVQEHGREVIQRGQLDAPVGQALYGVVAWVERAEVRLSQRRGD